MPKTKGLRSYAPSLCLLAAAICLCPVAASAQSWNPTASDGNGNTAAGTGALDAVLGDNNTAIGRYALNDNTFGDENTAIGAYALSKNTTGIRNTASGIWALYSNTTGAFNVANGDAALYWNTTGTNNTAGGYVALYSNTTGRYNTARGSKALYSNTTGSRNTAAGFEAMFSNSNGVNNVALGYQALRSNQTGDYNVAVGYGALTKLKGTGNVALGANAGKNTVFGNYNIYIGHPGINGNEGKVTRIGTMQRRVFIAGIAGVPASGANVVVRANGQLGVVASSARYKQDIEPLGDKAAKDMAGKLAQLRPVSYRYKAEPQGTHYGLIAEQVAAVMPELVVRDGRNRPESVQYLELVPLLLQQWKAQHAVNARQRDLIARQQARLERQEADLTALRHTLAIQLAELDSRVREN